MATETTAAPRRAQRLMQVLGPFLGLAAVVAFFGVVAPSGFLSVYNFKTVATQTVIVGLGAIGMTFIIVSGGIDLSVGSVIALASVVTALVMREGGGAVVALLAGVATGTLCGLANGALITGLRIVPFIVTLGTLGMARGLAKYLAGEQKIDADAGWLAELMTKSPEPAWIFVSPGVWLLFGLALIAAFTLRRTVLGVWTFALGSNEATARLCGVPVARTKVWIYAVGGLFAGLAGVMQFGRLTVGDPTTAMGKELDVIAAVVIGGASLSGGTGSILGSIVGAFLMSTLANGCNLAGVPNFVQEILIGAIIIVAVALDAVRHRRA
jgi:ribose/xylose/arabinose/galactoside ABC-type transport system permease subunit